MTIAVDLGRKATKQTKSMLVNEIMQLNWVQLVLKYSILINLNPITLNQVRSMSSLRPEKTGWT